MNENMTDLGAGMNDGAVNVYDNGMSDEFPVLKAFQQYIDAEQAKARKRVMMLCIFFSFLLTVVISVFVVLLVLSSSKNQTLNDRLVEYAMKDRERSSVVQHAAPVDPKEDSAILLALSNKMEELQKAVAKDHEQAVKAAEEAAVAKEKRSTAESLEIERLKALLAAEKEKAAAEREKQRQAELEAYRREHYPELYGKKSALRSSAKDSRKKNTQREAEEVDREIESILNDVKAIDYFDEDESDEDDETASESRNSTKGRAALKNSDPLPLTVTEAPDSIKDASGNTWGIPND